MGTKHTKGELNLIILKYPEEPKEIITGVGISENLNGGIYSKILFDTILPDGDKEYINQHAQIKADCERVVKCWNSHDELLEALKLMLGNFMKSSYVFINQEKAVKKAKQAIKKATD